MVIFKYLFITILLAGVMARAGAEPSEEAQATVVIYNAAQPSSTALAEYYAKRREIPSDHLIGLHCSNNEEITRDDYYQTIARPVREAFADNGWWQVEGGQVTKSTIRFVALMRGVPMKIAPTPVPPGGAAPAPLNNDNASVDSELSCLGFPARSPAGFTRNPYAGRLTPILESEVDPGLLLVCRLDAMSDATVRRMIDDSIATEKTGLWGWAYVDARGLKDGPFLMGDQWLGNLANGARKSGVPVLWDKASDTLPLGYPVTDAAIYYGWYAFNICGAMLDPAMHFRRGAVAVHLYSFSASTLRGPNNTRWCCQLLEHGAAATLGNVYEPYLALTTQLDLFQQRLMAGYTFAESAYMATPALSWMNVSIGDPLYRPYAVWQDSSSLVGEKTTDWMQYRQIILDANGDVLAAADALRAAAKQTGDSMFLESLAAVQADSGDFASALTTLSQALLLPNPPLVAFRLSLEKLGVLRTLGKLDDARALLRSLLAQPVPSAQAALLKDLRSQLLPPSGSSARTP